MLDLNLPRRTGLEVLADLKADLDLLTIPVAQAFGEWPCSSSHGKAAVDRGAAEGTRKVTGVWPGDEASRKA